jgi:hypothetical protein
MDVPVGVCGLWVEGAIVGVSGYREKILALQTLDQEELAGVTPHVCVPAASIIDGVLIDRDEVTVTALKGGGGQHTLLGKSQVIEARSAAARSCESLKHVF